MLHLHFICHTKSSAPPPGSGFPSLNRLQILSLRGTTGEIGSEGIKCQTFLEWGNFFLFFFFLKKGDYINQNDFAYFLKRETSRVVVA